jgi:hypothetical protein
VDAPAGAKKASTEASFVAFLVLAHRCAVAAPIRGLHVAEDGRHLRHPRPAAPVVAHTRQRHPGRPRQEPRLRLVGRRAGPRHVEHLHAAAGAYVRQGPVREPAAVPAPPREQLQQHRAEHVHVVLRARVVAAVEEGRQPVVGEPGRVPPARAAAAGGCVHENVARPHAAVDHAVRVQVRQPARGACGDRGALAPRQRGDVACVALAEEPVEACGADGGALDEDDPLAWALGEADDGGEVRVGRHGERADRGGEPPASGVHEDEVRVHALGGDPGPRRVHGEVPPLPDDPARVEPVRGALDVGKRDHRQGRRRRRGRGAGAGHGTVGASRGRGAPPAPEQEERDGQREQRSGGTGDEGVVDGGHGGVVHGARRGRSGRGATAGVERVPGARMGIK